MQDYERSVFISYAWGGESEEIVNQIDQALQQRGLKIIRDKRGLGYKGSISAFMERIGLGNCVIVVISDKYLRSPNCMFELVEIAEGKQFHDRVFPIVLKNADIYDPVRRLEYVKHWEIRRGELAQAMKEVDPANLQGIREDIDLYDRIRDKISSLISILKDMNTLTPDMHRNSDFNEIYIGIEKRTAKPLNRLKAETTSEEIIEGEPPYMGLRYFDTADATLFYGRESLTRELAKRVAREPFLVIVGASGSGKSSVARAGLIPAWKSITKGTVHVITPTVHPLESIAVSLTRESESVTATATLMDDLKNDTRSLRLYVRKILNGSGETNMLLVVDQFEETFTLCKDPDERKAFIESLLSLATEDDEVVRVVLTLRADFYHHCAEFEGLRLVLEKHQAYIGVMTPDELREAITAPAQKNGWGFQPGLVDLILQDVGTEPGALPLLSHALLETWKRRQGYTLTLQGYSDAGGVKKAITQTAESVYDRLSPAEQIIARGIFLRLTELGEGVPDTRRRAKLDELSRATETRDAVAKVLKTLTDARLVTTEQDSVEVAHEALIREWGTLRKWLDEDRENLRLHRHLTESAKEWEHAGMDETFLVHRGARLEYAIQLSRNQHYQLNEIEKRYLDECQWVGKRDKAADSVKRLLSSTLDLTTLFEQTVNLIQSSFGYFFVAIFLVHESSRIAFMKEGSGELSAVMKKQNYAFPIGSNSVVGLVIENGKTIVINNTKDNPVHHPHPLLPETVAEVGIPLKTGQSIIGALNIQSNSINAFRESDIEILESVADQVAVTFYNARSFQELDQTKNKIYENMSHELRTPLNSVIGFTRVILKGIDGPITDLQKQDLTAIYNSGQHLLSLINDILDFNRLTMGNLSLNLEEINVTDVINFAMTTATDFVKEKPVKLSSKITTDLPTVTGDKERLRQILLNLLSNAAKFTEEGLITVEASVQDDTKGLQEVIIKVSDTGIGISREDQTKIFKANSQVDGSVTHKSRRLGLGLPICVSLVQMHGGRMWVVSELGKGSSFYFTIPVFQQ